MSKSRLRYFLAENSNQSFTDGISTITFQFCGTFAGVGRGVYATGNPMELDLLAQNQNKVREISEGDYMIYATALTKAGIILKHGSPIPFIPPVVQARVEKPVEPKKLPKGERVFYHSGDYGDLIYSLPAIQAAGGGTLTLGMVNRCAKKQRGQMTEERSRSIIPLLANQPCIHDVFYVSDDVFYASGQPEGAIDLNFMREVYHAPYTPWRTIKDTYCDLLKVKALNTPWLKIPKVPGLEGKIIINRTKRYRTPSFPWEDIVWRLASRIIFIGSDEEYEDFVSLYGQVERGKVIDLFEIAIMIASSELFIGNQSCLRAIAAGLGRTTVMEGFLPTPDCHFPSSVNFYGPADRDKVFRFLKIQPIPRSSRVC